MTSGDRKCARCGRVLVAGQRLCSSCGLEVSQLVPGQTLDGKYEILDKTAEGGMGEVYRARHVHLDAIRIIKVTKPDALGDGLAQRRFQEEARIATLVRHPNVAVLYDFSRQADGSCYMVWEFIDGVTLQSWLSQRGPLPLPRALEVAQQVLAGLGELHSQGIVHRDLAPDNIMLNELPGGGLQAKIIDFGIAKRVSAESLQMTGTGLFLGKLKYCSPEQAGALPLGETVDGRSDIYSFGAVLYEMLSGRPPFEAQTPQEYLGKHLHVGAPPLDVSMLPSHVGSALRAIVAKSLEKRREDRFRDTREFATALAGLTSQAPISPERLLTRSREHRRLRVALPWIVLSLVLVAVGAYTARRRSAPHRIVSVLPTAIIPASRRSPTEAAAPVVVVATPGISERATPVDTPRPHPTRRATHLTPTFAPPRPVLTLTPGIVAGVASPPVALDARQRLDPQYARQRLRNWLSRPVEERARRALEIAKWANRLAKEHPEHPQVLQVEKELPRLFRGEALAALDERRPVLAGLFYDAYVRLDFSPPDSELARRFNQRSKPKHE